MKSSIQQPELQLLTLNLYGEFLCRRDNWAGQLALAAFAGAGATGFAAAASLAGAAALVVDSDAESVKAHFRDGAFDFVVHTLDEALRTIKNEVRLGRPIAIGVIAEPAAVLLEAAERGIAASLMLCGPEGFAENLHAVSAGAVKVEQTPSEELRRWLVGRRWSAAEVGHSAPEDVIRQRWLRDLPAHQRSVRQGKRWVWMSADETVSPE